eukprot:4497290-Lingulodinium_polyedra.AAC.1
MLRPADIQTGIPDPSGRLAALDVGIIAPTGAGNDCVETHGPPHAAQSGRVQERPRGHWRGVPGPRHQRFRAIPG